MKNIDLEAEKAAYLLDENFFFRTELNKMYDELCYSIRKRKKEKEKAIKGCLKEIVFLITNHWSCVTDLPREELYMVLNSIKLAKAAHLIEEINYNEEEFQQFDEFYKNSR